MPVKPPKSADNRTKNGGAGKNLSTIGPTKEKSIMQDLLERKIAQNHALAESQVKLLGGRSGFENMIRAQQARVQGFSSSFV